MYGLTFLSLSPELYRHSHHLVLALLAFSSAQRKINIYSILFIYFFNASHSPSNLFHRRVTTADEKTRVRGFTKISHLLVTRVLKDRLGSAHAAGGARGKVSQWPQAYSPQKRSRLVRRASQPHTEPPIVGRCRAWWLIAQNTSQSELLPDKLNSNLINAELSIDIHNLGGAGVTCTLAGLSRWVWEAS